MKLADLIARFPAEGDGAGQGKDVTARFVRFLISEGVIPPPGGIRSNPEYTEAHVEGVRRYRALRALGLSMEATKAVMAGDGGEREVPLGPGVRLVVDPSAMVPGVTLESLQDAFAQAVAAIMPKESTDAEDGRHDED